VNDPLAEAGAAAIRRRYHSISTCPRDNNAFAALRGDTYVRTVAAMVAVAEPRRLIMFAKITKTLIAAVVLASTSLTLVANAYAAPTQASSQAEQTWMDRASNPDTNGF
jgi:hypothetical protein